MAALRRYAYQRLEFKFTLPKEESIASAAEYKAHPGWSPQLEARLEGVGTGEGRRTWEPQEPLPNQYEMAEHDIELFLESLTAEEAGLFERVYNEALAEQETAGDMAILLTMAGNVTTDPTMGANNKVQSNDRVIASWESESLPDLLAMTEEWSKVDVVTASDATLLEGIRMLAVEEGAYWAADAGHTFGVGKSTDDHLQKFLRDLLPDHKFTSGQFLSGFKSRVMQANDDLSAIASEIKQSEALTVLVATASHVRLMEMLQQTPEAAAVVSKLGEYLDLYGVSAAAPFALRLLSRPQSSDCTASGFLAGLCGAIAAGGLVGSDADPSEHGEGQRIRP